MKSLAQIEEKLRKLRAARALPASQCSKAFLNFIKPLIEGGALSWQRSGGGRCLAVKETDTVERFYRQNFPNALVPHDAGSRVSGLAQFRDTKAKANTEAEIVSLRSWREGVLLKQGKPVPTVSTTTEHGLFSFLCTAGNTYQLRGAFALAENPAVFTKVEHVGLQVDAVIYGNGRISNRLLDWLAGMPEAEFTLLHLPDYDPLGLTEYLRLSTRLGNRVTLYLPDDLEARFREFSKSQLLKKERQQFFLAQLRRSKVEAVREVVTLIDRYNAGLEQEALLVNI